MMPGALAGEVSYRIGSAADLQVAMQALPRQRFLAALSEVDRMLIATIASELGTNIVKYAGRGNMRICSAERMHAMDVDIWAEDHGRGIADVELAMTDRYSTGGTLGLGLPGVRRMADEFWIRSNVGQGTLVFARKSFSTGPAARSSSMAPPAQPVSARVETGQSDRHAWGMAWRPYPGNPFTGDAACVITRGPVCLMAMIDASGHGRGASQVARTVMDRLQAYQQESLEQLFDQVHKELLGTQGAAMGLAQIDERRNTLRYAATGNTRIIGISDHQTWTGLARDGVLGNRLPTLQVQEMPLKGNDLIVMWTDGIPDFEGRKLVEQNGFKAPQDVASLLVKELARPYDDACCLALRWNA